MMILPGRPSWRKILLVLGGAAVVVFASLSLSVALCERPDARSRVRTSLTARYGPAEAERRMRVYENGIKGKSEGGRDLFWQATEGQLAIPQVTLNRMAYERSPEYRRKSETEAREAYATTLKRRRTNDPILSKPTSALLGMNLANARRSLVKVGADPVLSFRSRLANANVRLSYATSVLPSTEIDPLGAGVGTFSPRTIARDGLLSLPVDISLDLTYVETDALMAMRRVGLNVAGAKRLTSPYSQIERWHLPKLPKIYQAVTVTSNYGLIDGISISSAVGSSIREPGPSDASTNVGR